MIRKTITALFGIILFMLSGCGCGDRRFSRELVIIDHRGDGSNYAVHPIEVDTSQLDTDAVESRKDGNASWMCYEPHTVLHIDPKVPIKLLIVPASQPSKVGRAGR